MTKLGFSPVYLRLGMLFVRSVRILTGQSISLSLGPAMVWISRTMVADNRKISGSRHSRDKPGLWWVGTDMVAKPE
jgi:hypothetical protein